MNPVELENSRKNITHYLFEYTSANANKPAFLHPVHCTFGTFWKEVERIGHGFQGLGINKGTRTIVLIKPGIHLFAVTYALLRIGAIPVMVDPGMGVRKMVKTLSKAEAAAFVGIPRSIILRFLFRGALGTIRTWVSSGKRWGLTIHSLHQFPSRSQELVPCQRDPDELAAIFFTSGSTGAPKGVMYSSRMLEAQIMILKNRFGYTPDEVDLCTFPLVALLVLTQGIPVVLADMDMVHPSRLNPDKLIENIRKFACSHMFCSPMVIRKLNDHGTLSPRDLSSLRKVMVAGAPLTPDQLRKFQERLSPHTEVHTPYGATEALPVTDITGKELLEIYDSSEPHMEGICVGHPIKDLEVSIIKISDAPLDNVKDHQIDSNHEVGEITLTGANVTRSYWQEPLANQLAKVEDADGNRIWHRTGDLGRWDEKGRLWYYGRKSQRVETLERTYFTIPVEAVFNQHPDVRRSALVGVKSKQGEDIIPVICIERVENKKRKIYLQEELRSLGSKFELTKDINRFLFIRRFPVDPRHNAKIFREKLTSWANHKVST